MKKLIILIIILQISSCGNDERIYSLAMEDEVLELVNLHRNSLGLKSLKMNQVILEEARLHSYNMAKGTTAFGHDGFGDRVKRIKQHIGGGGGSENVALGYHSAQSVVNGWIGSSSHKKNMEGNHDITGIGICRLNNGRIYYTQIFMKE
jgi:uncharacterized protein YkwD